MIGAGRYVKIFTIFAYAVSSLAGFEHSFQPHVSLQYMKQ